MSAHLLQMAREARPGLGRAGELLVWIAWHCPENLSESRTVGGQLLKGNEAYIPQRVLAQEMGVSPRRVAQMAKELEGYGLKVRVWQTGPNGTSWTAKPGHATVYRFPFSAELQRGIEERARQVEAKLLAREQQEERVKPASAIPEMTTQSMEAAHEAHAQMGEADFSHRVKPASAIWVKPASAHKVLPKSFTVHKPQASSISDEIEHANDNTPCRQEETHADAPTLQSNDKLGTPSMLGGVA